ncbi:NAD(P)/FAD-dependent oxidoreductase [Paenisporosarcina sp. TG20]|uniref:NAD(P)/FAD-dependent oxidoreductase n=1 Tax=Paenisporosarcina sp. TG20 TaxID=1211706 RepID=UPI0002F99D6B|nr:NAD(P)/FAD-dependent oxidoreductase [Paenisporosarcina sp. TG20]
MKDCTIVGGGPSGLSATLVLGRARRNVILVDNNEARNKVTSAANGFVTRDGIKPAEFREQAHKEFSEYPTIETMEDKVVKIEKLKEGFIIKTQLGKEWTTRKVILATGVKEKFPNIPNLRDFYGKSIYNCPYCDGWELRDKPLALFGIVNYTFHTAEILRNWSQDLIVFTNGQELTKSQAQRMKKSKLRVETSPVLLLTGKDGILQKVELENGLVIDRVGGFVTPELVQATELGTKLGLKLNDKGGHHSDEVGNTKIDGLFVAGEASNIYPSQLIIAAASGAETAMAVNVELTHEGVLGSQKHI